jgi:hypothetical protein
MSPTEPRDLAFRFGTWLQQEAIHPPNVTEIGKQQKRLAQNSTRALMHTEVCASLNDVVGAFGSSSRFRQVLEEVRVGGVRDAALDTMAEALSNQVGDTYLAQASRLKGLPPPSTQAIDFLNLYTAALINAAKTYIALGRVACKLLVEKGEKREEAGRELVLNNRHIARQLSHLPQPVFNLFLNLNGDNIPGKAKAYRFPTGNFVITHSQGSMFLLPSASFLDDLVAAANSPETSVCSYDRFGRIVTERFRHAYNAWAEGCPAFKRGPVSSQTQGRPGVAEALLDSLDEVILETLFGS